MKCLYCTYFSANPQDTLTHMITVHGITQQLSPPELMPLWQQRGAGYWESPNPLTLKAPDHQKAAQRRQVIQVFSPSGSARSIITPSTPPPWIKLDESNYVITEVLTDTPTKKITLSGKLTPGHGYVKILRTETYEVKNIFQQIHMETDFNEQILIEEFYPFTNSPEYKRWEINFLHKTISQINLLKNKLYNSI